MQYTDIECKQQEEEGVGAVYGTGGGGGLSATA